MFKRIIVWMAIVLPICSPLIAQNGETDEDRRLRLLEEARKVVEKGISDAGDIIPPKVKTAFYEYYYGVKALNEGKNDEAVIRLKQSMEDDPQGNWAVYSYGLTTAVSGREYIIATLMDAYSNLGDNDSALKLLEYELEHGNTSYHGFVDDIVSLVNKKYTDAESRINYYREKSTAGIDILKSYLVKELLNSQTELYYRYAPEDSHEYDDFISGLVPNDNVKEAWQIAKEDIQKNPLHYYDYSAFRTTDDTRLVWYLSIYKDTQLEQELVDELKGSNSLTGVISALALTEMDRREGIEFFINHLDDEDVKYSIGEDANALSVKSECLEYLKKYTKKDFGYDKQEWLNWWYSEGKDRWSLNWSKDWRPMQPVTTKPRDSKIDKVEHKLNNPDVNTAKSVSEQYPQSRQDGTENAGSTDSRIIVAIGIGLLAILVALFIYSKLKKIRIVYKR